MPGRSLEAPICRRAQFLAAVAEDEVHRPGGHGEALGWVLADLAAGWPLRNDYGPLTAAVAGRPELARALVAAAGFVPACIEYGEHSPGGRYVGWRHRWAGTAGELWDAATAVVR
ncbi:hypothetical protein [Geodermatophilus sabuli]|nr:hypothetical protein [Geodermatophilus sabuli]MBB3084226.1 hypothetical protein [Geodermatophilus sabuli]